MKTAKASPSLSHSVMLQLYFHFVQSSKSWLTPLPEKSYKRECQETFLSVGSVPILFCLGIQPNWLNVHSHSESGLAQV
jgi:hypothetical protein